MDLCIVCSCLLFLLLLPVLEPPANCLAAASVCLWLRCARGYSLRRSGQRSTLHPAVCCPLHTPLAIPTSAQHLEPHLRGALLPVSELDLAFPSALSPTPERKLRVRKRARPKPPPPPLRAAGPAAAASCRSCARFSSSSGAVILLRNGMTSSR